MLPCEIKTIGKPMIVRRKMRQTKVFCDVGHATSN